MVEILDPQEGETIYDHVLTVLGVCFWLLLSM